MNKFLFLVFISLSFSITANDFLGATYTEVTDLLYQDYESGNRLGVKCEEYKEGKCTYFGLYEYRSYQDTSELIIKFEKRELKEISENVFQNFKETVYDDYKTLTFEATKFIWKHRIEFSDVDLTSEKTLVVPINGAALAAGAYLDLAYLMPVSYSAFAISRTRLIALKWRFKQKFRKYLKNMMNPKKKGKIERFYRSRYNAFKSL